MQPSRPVSADPNAMITGSNRTSSPWHDRALRCPVTFTAKARRGTPIWVAASPTQAGRLSWCPEDRPPERGHGRRCAPLFAPGNLELRREDPDGNYRHYNQGRRLAQSTSASSGRTVQ